MTPSGVDLLALNRPVTVTLAHKGTDYLFSEDNTVSAAWPGPFSVSEKYWLYWDFDLLTFTRTFGMTTLEPVVQSVEPGYGNKDIVGVIAGIPEVGSFVVEGQFVLTSGKPFDVVNSTGNDGTYTVFSATFSGISGETTIVVNEEVVDSTVDGELTLDVDSEGFPLRTVGRMWYDTINNAHYVWQGSSWGEVLRVFSALVINGSTFISLSINAGSGDFTGTQTGDTASVRSGRVLFDEASNTIRRDDRTFFTTEDQFFANASRVDAIRLESNVQRAQSNDSTIAEFSVVSFRADGLIETGQYNDTGTTVVGVLTEDLLYHEVGGVIIQGVVTNPSWNWSEVGAELWVDNGELVDVDPHVSDVITYPTVRVPCARVLDSDTVVFEQGLGGVGPVGPMGDPASVPAATTSSAGTVVLVTPSSTSDPAFVISDTDPRLADARSPLPHNHIAVDITYTPAGGITSNNVQGALTELGLGKVDISGGTMTGFLELNADPTDPLHAATKQYVDDTAGVGAFVNITGDTMTGFLELNADPTDPLHASTKQYVDDLITTHTHNIPYDLAYFIGGNLVASEIMGSFVATRNISIALNAPGSYAATEIPVQGGDPDQILNIVHNGSTIGTVTFAALNTTGTIAIAATSLVPGDRLQLIAPVTVDTNLKDISISLVACAAAPGCSL